MDVLLFCPIWGLVPDYVDVISADLDAVFLKVKQGGYDGIEMTIPANDNQVEEVNGLLKKYDLQLIAHQWANNGQSVEELMKAYETHLERAIAINPLFVNSHTGKDYLSFEQNSMFIEKAFQLQKDNNIKIYHEIHRGRFSFHCYTMVEYLKAFPDLSLTADFSHWCNVSESYLESQAEHLERAIGHCKHIHARVGHTQSCQVNHPAAPEWKAVLGTFLQWWDQIYEHNLASGEQFLTITPEFGPEPYMSTLPFSKVPVANQWAINLWMKDLLKQRYQNKNNN